MTFLPLHELLLRNTASESHLENTTTMCLPEIVFDNAAGHSGSVVSEEQKRQRLLSRKQRLQEEQQLLNNNNTAMRRKLVGCFASPAMPYRPSLAVTAAFAPTTLPSGKQFDAYSAFGGGPNKTNVSKYGGSNNSSCSALPPFTLRTARAAPFFLPGYMQPTSLSPQTSGDRWDTSANSTDQHPPSPPTVKKFAPYQPTTSTPTFALSDCAKMTLRMPRRRDSMDFGTSNMGAGSDHSASSQGTFGELPGRASGVTASKQSTADLIQQALLDLDLSDSEDEDDDYFGDASTVFDDCAKDKPPFPAPRSFK